MREKKKGTSIKSLCALPLCLGTVHTSLLCTLPQAGLASPSCTAVTLSFLSSLSKPSCPHSPLLLVSKHLPGELLLPPSLQSSPLEVCGSHGVFTPTLDNRITLPYSRTCLRHATPLTVQKQRTLKYTRKTGKGRKPGSEGV